MSQSQMPSLLPATASAKRSSEARSASSARRRSVMSVETPLTRAGSPPCAGIMKPRSWIQRTVPSGWTMRNSASQRSLARAPAIHRPNSLPMRGRSSGWMPATHRCGVRVQVLDGAAPDLLEARARVDHALGLHLGHPHDVGRGVGHVPEAGLALAQAVVLARQRFAACEGFREGRYRGRGVGGMCESRTRSRGDWTPARYPPA